MHDMFQRNAWPSRTGPPSRGHYPAQGRHVSTISADGGQPCPACGKSLLDLDYPEARFGSVDEICKSEAGRDILAEPTLLFADAGKQASARAAVPSE